MCNFTITLLTKKKNTLWREVIFEDIPLPIYAPTFQHKNNIVSSD